MGIFGGERALMGGENGKADILTQRDASTDVEKWISHHDAADIFSGGFWNDEEVERAKQWWVTDGDTQSLTTHIEALGVYEAFAAATEALRSAGKLRGRVLDAGAGTCCSAALWSRLSEIEHVDAVEFSWHRISLLAGPTIAALNGRPEKISRIFGSFTDIHRPDGSYEIATMTAAFHHCSEPELLISELDRCLSPGGVIVLMGEEPVGRLAILRRFAADLLKRRRFHCSFEALFPPHPQIGDHYYRFKDYRRLFNAAGYDVRFLSVGNSDVVIVATRQTQHGR